MESVTLAERPVLAQATYDIPYPSGTSRFMEGNLAALLVRRRRVIDRWPQLVVALLDPHRPVARGVMVPFSAAGEERCRYPAGGWDQVAVWAAEDALDGTTPDTVCGLEIAVHPAYQGEGLAAVVLRAMRAAAAAAGFATLVIPLRPPEKARYPTVPMREYLARTRPDGLPSDRWVRTHLRAGGRIEGLAPCSSTVQAPLDQWRQWTGLPFDQDGPVVVPGALAPVFVSTAHDVAVYVEPNVWVSHVVS